MALESLKIKNCSYYFWDDTIYLDELDNYLIKLVKRESLIYVNIYYIGYIAKKPKYDVNSLNPFYLNIRDLIGCMEKINGSDDRYLVIDKNTAEPSNKKMLSVLTKMWKFIEDKISLMKDKYKITFGNDVPCTIKDWDKIRLNSNIDLPLDTSIQFHSLTTVINCVIEKGNKYYPEIYLDQGLYIRA